jgi:hypothetical protein
MWKSYNTIPKLPQGYTHLTVNHSQNFIDPISGCHTQNVEGMWSNFKRNFRPLSGNTTETYASYFPEFMWRKRFGDSPNVFYNFWSHVSLVYQCEHL